RKRPAAKRTSDMFISMRVLRAYWYSWVPSSSSVRRRKNCRDSSRASRGATARGSATPGRLPSPVLASVFSSTTCACDRITAVSITSPHEHHGGHVLGCLALRTSGYPACAHTCTPCSGHSAAGAHRGGGHAVRPMVRASGQVGSPGRNPVFRQVAGPDFTQGGTPLPSPRRPDS